LLGAGGGFALSAAARIVAAGAGKKEIALAPVAAVPFIAMHWA